MKIQLCSDIHLEFEPTWRPQNVGSDVLILSGDIVVADIFTKSEASPKFAYKQNFLDFFRHCNENWDKVIYLMGNHEYYHSTVEDTPQILETVLSEFENIKFLNDDFIVHNNVIFAGGTLWTNMNKSDPIVIYNIRNMMNDFRLVRVKSDGYRSFDPRDAVIKHNSTISVIKKAGELAHTRMLEYAPMKMVVCTHHAPCVKSIHADYIKDQIMNYGYYSDLTNLILDNPWINLWTHGHVHNSFDYQVGDTRVVCNPRGYHDSNINFDMSKIIEI